MEFVALDTEQLNALAKQDPYLKWVYDGTFPCDLLPRFPNKHRPTAYIVNTDPAGQPGQHWIALWTRDGICEVMDSYGLPLEWYGTTQPIVNWISKHWKHWVHNGTSLQGLHSYACGHCCMAYLKCKARGGSLQDFLALFYEDDFVQNDQRVGDMVEYVVCGPGKQSCQPREKVIKSVGW